MQSTGQTSIQASQPVQLSARMTAISGGSFLRGLPAALAMWRSRYWNVDCPNTVILKSFLEKARQIPPLPYPAVRACFILATEAVTSEEQALMPSPATVAEFLAIIRQSGVVEDSRLDAYLNDQPDTPLPERPEKLAGALILHGVLTHFQAEQFL